MISKVPGAAPPPSTAPRHPLPPWGRRSGGSILGDGAGTLGWMLARNRTALRPRGQSAGQVSLPAALPTATSLSQTRSHTRLPARTAGACRVPKPSEDRGQ